METGDSSLAHEIKVSDWTGSCNWSIDNWSTRTKEKIFSPEFEIGTYSWRLFVCPGSNNDQRTSEYLEVGLNFPEASFTPSEMFPKVNFKVTAVKLDCPEQSRTQEAVYTFSYIEADWTFSQFMPLQEVQNPQNGYLVNDALTLKTSITIENYDPGLKSKLETGFVGIKRSYENKSLLTSYLHCFFHIKAFRKAVYQMPIQEYEDSQKSLLLALQHLFYALQYQSTSVKIYDLLDALSRKYYEMHFQHDVTKIQSAFFEKLIQEDNAGSAKDCISELFIGQYSNYVESSNVHDIQACKQSFMEIQLNILDCEDIYASLERFCQLDSLEEDCQSEETSEEADESKHYVLFDSFPTVLQLNLNRCYYNQNRRSVLRMNSYYEFYDELDLDYKDHLLHSENADRAIENKYRLLGVVVHVDDSDEGHYCAYIRHKEKWYKFDGEVVTAVSAEEAINAQFGDQAGTANANFSERFESINKSAAVMLFYIRKSEWERVMCETGKQHIPEQIQAPLDNEQKVKLKRHIEKQRAHLYVNIKLATEFRFIDQVGEAMDFDSSSLDAIKQYRIHKKTPFEDFKEMVSEDFGIPKHLQRFWQWELHQNYSMQVSELSAEGAHQLKTILDLKHFVSRSSHFHDDKTVLLRINLFLESPQVGRPGRDGILPRIREGDLMVFVKYYDPVSMKLSCLGHAFIRKTSSFKSILKGLKKMAGLGQKDKVIGTREYKHGLQGMWPDLLPERLPRWDLMRHGQIIIIQKVVENSNCRYPTIRSFLEHLDNTKTINFRPIKNPLDEGFKLDLLKTMSYDQVTTELANHLQVDDPKRFRLTRHKLDTHMPCRRQLESYKRESLERMILDGGQYTYILYYEVLDHQLQYLETLRRFTIRFHNAKGERQSEHKIMLTKSAKVSDLVEALNAELGEEYIDCEMRIMMTSLFRNFKVLGSESIIEQHFFWSSVLRAEVIPEDHKNLRSDEFLVLFFHCKQDDDSEMTVFGDPLLVKVKEGETVRKVKVRIQKTIEISDEEFRQWKFVYYVHPMHPIEYLADHDEILAKFPNFKTTGRANRKLVSDKTSFIAFQH